MAGTSETAETRFSAVRCARFDFESLCDDQFKGSFHCSPGGSTSVKTDKKLNTWPRYLVMAQFNGFAATYFKLCTRTTACTRGGFFISAFTELHDMATNDVKCVCPWFQDESDEVHT